MPTRPHVSISAASVTPELRARWRIVASTASAWRRRDCVFVNSVRTAHAVAREGFMAEILSRAPRQGSGQRLRAPPVEKRTGWSGNRFPAPVCVHHVGFGLTFQRSAPILLGRERNPRKKGWGVATVKAAEILKTCDKEGVRFLRLQFTDILGIIKNVEVPRSQFEKALDGEIKFDGSSIEGFTRIEESDMGLVPDLDTFRIFPWSHSNGKVARVVCDVITPDGKAFAGCPRRTRKLQMEKAKAMGYTLMTGPEAEFFLFMRDANGDPIVDTHDQGGYFDLTPVDLEAHRLERDDAVAAGLLATVDRGEVEVAALVVRVDDRIAVRVPHEEEELGLRPGHERVAHGLRLLHLALQGLARTAREGLAIGRDDVADDAGDLSVRVRPREDAERVEIRHEAHVGFLDAREALDRRPVELDLAVERFLKLRARDFDVLDDPEDVRKLQTQEPDAFLVASLQNLGRFHCCHAPPLFSRIPLTPKENRCGLRESQPKTHMMYATGAG